MSVMLVRVVAPHFVAGFEMDNGRCVRAAPILGWCVGRTTHVLRAYFARRKWAAHVVTAETFAGRPKMDTSVIRDIERMNELAAKAFPGEPPACFRIDKDGVFVAREHDRQQALVLVAPHVKRFEALRAALEVLAEP